MAKFPKIQSPCPYKSNLAAVMDGDHCRMCNRQVFDLSAMADGERAAFLAGCSGEICVSYRFMRPALAAAALAAASVALPAHAQQVAAVGPTEIAAAGGDVAVPDEDMYIEVGGIKDVANMEFVEDATDGTIPALPVTYEDEAPTSTTAPAR